MIGQGQNTPSGCLDDNKAAHLEEKGPFEDAMIALT
jgi:hypothetical protein